MAASLANGGLCPLSGDQVLSPGTTRSMLSMMQVAGMKDYSTTFHYKVRSIILLLLNIQLLGFLLMDRNIYNHMEGR